jgi:6-phosphogluconolactonase
VHIALTGGTVGIATLARFAEIPEAKSFDYSKVHFWWGDERFVNHDSAERNAKQAHDAMFRHLDVESNNIHPFPAADEGEGLDAAAVSFASLLASFAEPGQTYPNFDVVLLGMGPDGHIASLFPGKALPMAGATVFAEHDSPKPPPQRLTFTYDVLNGADEIWFTVAGAEKADAVSVAFSEEPQRLPVGRVHGTRKTIWFVDQTAGATTWGC